MSLEELKEDLDTLIQLLKLAELGTVRLVTREISALETAIFFLGIEIDFIKEGKTC